MAVALRVALAAQALEDGIELLQPGPGIDAVVGFAQLCEFVQGGLADRVQRCGGLDRGLARQALKQLERAPQQQGQQRRE